MAAGATRIDHAVMGVRDIATAVARFTQELGLPELLRSEHPQWGTCNAVVAVGPGQFVELLAVADETSRSPLVRGLKYLLADGDRMVGLCVRPPGLDAVAARLGLPIIPGERHEPDGVLRFRRTVPEDRPDMPFFIEWAGDQAALDARYAGAGGEILWAEFGGDSSELRDWLGDGRVPVRAVGGRRGPQRFAIRTADGSEIVIE
jgi:hypothetical protein